MAKNVRIETPFDTNKIRVSQNPTFPDAYIVDLPLNSVPDGKWRDAFELKWKSSRDLWDRKLSLVRDKVRLITTADGFVEKLEWVDETIDKTNNAIKQQYCLIEKEKEIIRDATTRHALLTETPSTRIIVETLRRRLNM
jgi:hypothetical protein